MRSFIILLVCLFLIQPSMANDRKTADKACWFHTSFIYMHRVDQGWVITNLNGDLFFIPSEPADSLGMCE